MNKVKQYLFSPSSLSLADQAIVSGGNFVVTILLARWLSTGDFGKFAIIWLMLLFASAIQQALVIAPMMTLFSKSENPKAFITNSLLQASTYIVLAVAFIWIAFQFLGDYFSATDLIVTPVFTLPLLVFAFLFYDFTRKLLLVKQQYLKAMIMDGVTMIVILALIIIAKKFYRLDLPNFITGYSAIQSAIGFFFLLQNQFTRTSGKAWWRQIRYHWQYSRWLVVTSGLQLFAGNFYIITAAAVLGPAAMAAIKVVQNIMGLINVLFLAMENYVPVKAAHIFHKSGKEKLFWYLKKNTLQQAIPLALILLVIVIAAEKILTLIYGPEFAQYADMLRLFAALYLVNYLGLPFRFAIRTLQKNGWILIAYLVSVAFSMVLAHHFIGWWHLAGVAIGMIISQLALNFTLILSFLPKIKFKWISYTWS